MIGLNHATSFNAHQIWMILSRLNRLFHVFFSSFDEDQWAYIHRHCWKERLQISKFTQFKGDASKASEDIAPLSRQILQTFVW